MLASRLPERTLAVALLVRGAVLWLVLRAAVGTGSALLVGRRTRSPFALSARTSIILVGIVGALSLLDARRRNEHRFLANLGVSESIIVLLSVIPAAVAEILAGVVGPR